MLARSRVDVLDVDRKNAGGVGLERGAAESVGFQLLAGQIRVDREESCAGQRLAGQQRRQQDVIALERRHDFQIRPLGLQAVHFVGFAGHGFRIMPQQERSGQGASQHAIIPLAGHHQRALDRHVGPQAISELAHFQRPEFAGRGLDPEFRAWHFFDEARIAGGRQFAEVDFGRAAPFGRRTNADKQKVRLRRGGTTGDTQQSGQKRKP